MPMVGRYSLEQVIGSSAEATSHRNGIVHGDDVPAELASALDAAVATNPDDLPATASELARLLRAAVPIDAVRLPGIVVAKGRALEAPTRVFGPRPPERVRPKRRRSKAPLLVVPLVLLAGVGSRQMGATGAIGASSMSSPVSCAESALPVPAGAQVVRGDTAGIGCLTTGVYANEVLTIRLDPGDPTPRRFAVGLPGDRIYLGDWNCDGIATPALLRLSTGARLYYDTWSTNEMSSDNSGGCRSIG